MQIAIEMPTMDEGFSFIQITDMHLFAETSGQLWGYCTYQLLVETIDHIQTQSLVKPTFILVSGDISQDESAQSYQLALEQLERFNCPVYWIHGNHDNPIAMQPIFDSSSKLTRLDTLSVTGWDFISINTCRHKSDEGYIDEEEYRRFIVRLEKAKQNKHNIAIVMHHHPIPINTPLLDGSVLQNSEKLLSIAKLNKEIKLVICGHVHGDCKIVEDELTIETCPATCFQWKKGTSTIQTEDKRGYKIFTFSPTFYSSSTRYI